MVRNECINFKIYNIRGQNYVYRRGTDGQTDRLKDRMNPISQNFVSFEGVIINSLYIFSN